MPLDQKVPSRSENSGTLLKNTKFYYKFYGVFRYFYFCAEPFHLGGYIPMTTQFSSKIKKVKIRAHFFAPKHQNIFGIFLVFFGGDQAKSKILLQASRWTHLRGSYLHEFARFLTEYFWPRKQEKNR